MSETVRHRYLVFGGSGAVGRYLLRRLHHEGCAALAVSRAPPPQWAHDWPSIRWCDGALPRFVPPENWDDATVLSAGPLDVFVGWAAKAVMPARTTVVALSSLSAVWKRQSPNPAERRLAEHLFACEERLACSARVAGWTLQVLRPSLIYGAGVDRSLAPLLRIAQRWRCLPWPSAGRGLRQPVHADDVAMAMLAAATLRSESGPLALPGGSTLPFDELVTNLLRRVVPRARLVRLPVPMHALQTLSAGNGRLAALASVLWRSADDQVADNDSWKKLGIEPRAFAPVVADFARWDISK